MKRILFIDRDDARRATRVMLLKRAGYEVFTSGRFEDVESHSEGRFDLVIIETDSIQEVSIAYGERLKSQTPKLPILLLSDSGLFLPKESLLAHFRGGHQTPEETMARIASLLLASTHERET